jgi:acid stress-induced BolA-like protein IbaG/YrbA
MPALNKNRVEQVLADALNLRDPEFRLEMAGGRISGSIISSTFKGKRDRERQKMIWDALEGEFGAEAVKLVGMLLAYTPEEWNLDLRLPA